MQWGEAILRPGIGNRVVGDQLAQLLNIADRRRVEDVELTRQWLDRPGDVLQPVVQREHQGRKGSLTAHAGQLGSFAQDLKRPHAVSVMDRLDQRIRARGHRTQRAGPRPALSRLPVCLTRLHLQQAEAGSLGIAEDRESPAREIGWSHQFLGAV